MASASRQRQAEMEEEGRKLRRQAATPPVEKLCALAAQSLAERRWQHRVQLAALETAHALADELS